MTLRPLELLIDLGLVKRDIPFGELEKNTKKTLWRATQNLCVGAVWEDLARDSVPHLSIGGKRWNQARRWWGKNASGQQVEIDVVAESVHKDAVLVGEAKWGAADHGSLSAKLRETAAGLPFAQGKQIVTAYWIGKATAADARLGAVTPDAVLEVLR